MQLLNDLQLHLCFVHRAPNTKQKQKTNRLNVVNFKLPLFEKIKKRHKACQFECIIVVNSEYASFSLVARMIKKHKIEAHSTVHKYVQKNERMQKAQFYAVQQHTIAYRWIVLKRILYARSIQNGHAKNRNKKTKKFFFLTIRKKCICVCFDT